MKKKLFFAAIALAALGSCTSDEFVGENNPNETNENFGNAIEFGTGVKAVTRGTSTDAALLNNNFVFFGTKGTSHSTVFNNYQANFKDNSANTTESNSSNWEYVSYKNLPNGVGTNVGVKEFAATTTGDQNNSSAIDQTIKYWDYSTSQYDFAAYSLGKGAGETPTYATASEISFATLGTKAYTLTGSADELAACYISDLVTAYNKQAVAANPQANPPVVASPKANDYGQPVQFKFRSLGTKIRIGFYETVPGYSVKDVKFYSIAYSSEDSENPTTATSTPTLFTSDAVLPSGSGTMTISFTKTGWENSPHDGNDTDYNKAHVSFAQASGVDPTSMVTFDALADYSTAEKKETSTDNPATGWIGRASNAATYAGGLVNGAGKYKTILPYETGANLLLRIKYTLVSTDGYGETIDVDNATAVVPAELAKWNPNYAYTYIFKISDMTNGSTGVDGNNQVVTGLTPITLDAVVVDSEDGVQETITTVSKPSITTYMAGKVITSNDEYIAGKDIYVIVNNGTSNVELVVGTNAKLFTATVESGAIQTISEASVDNAFAHGTYNSTAKTYTVTDAAGKKLTLTDTESTLLSAVTSIAATDSPTGNAITVNGAKFTPAAGTTYVFQYLVSNAVNYTASEANTYNAALPGAINANNTAYSFTSYADANGTTQYGTGKVKEISKVGEWTTVLVISNSVAGFVGNQYKVNATTMNENTYYELYTTEGSATGIYVKVKSYTFTEEEVNTYNATLPGAVSTSTIKDSGKYGYKIIKIAE